MNFILNLYIYTVFIFYTAVIIPFLTIYLFFIKLFCTERFLYKRIRRFISWYGFITLKVILFPFIKTKFIDTAAKEKVSPCIYVCNHRASSDPFLLSFLPNEIVQIISDWPFRIPVLGYMAKLAGYLSIKEMEHEDFFIVTEDLLKQGVCLAAFPEGTRSGSNKMGQFHGAIFRVALKVKCPIVPLCVVGNEKIPTRDFIMHTGTIKMKKMPAIYYEQYKDMTPFKFKNYVRSIILEETARMESE